MTGIIHHPISYPTSLSAKQNRGFDCSTMSHATTAVLAGRTRRTWSSTPSSSWGGWRCSCRGRGSTWSSTTACWGPGRPGGRRSCRARRRCRTKVSLEPRTPAVRLVHPGWSQRCGMRLGVARAALGRSDAAHLRLRCAGLPAMRGAPTPDCADRSSLDHPADPASSRTTLRDSHADVRARSATHERRPRCVRSRLLTKTSLSRQAGGVLVQHFSERPGAVSRPHAVPIYAVTASHRAQWALSERRITGLRLTFDPR